MSIPFPLFLLTRLAFLGIVTSVKNGFVFIFLILKGGLKFMIHVIRKDGESIENLFRRFNTKLRNSGNLYLVKGKKYFKKKITRNAQKKSAIHRTRVKNYYEFLVKSGQYDETSSQRSRR